MRTALIYWGRSQASAPTSTLVIHRPDEINWARVFLQFALGLILMGNPEGPECEKRVFLFQYKGKRNLLLENTSAPIPLGHS